MFTAKLRDRDCAIKKFSMGRDKLENLMKERDLMIYLKDRKHIYNIIGAFYEANAYILSEPSFGN